MLQNICRIVSFLVKCPYLSPDQNLYISDVNIIPLVRSNLHVSMSSTWGPFVAENAVDGRDTSSANDCYCCAGTVRGPSWWRLDLGAPYMIQSITFIGRRGKLLVVHACITICFSH